MSIHTAKLDQLRAHLSTLLRRSVTLQKAPAGAAPRLAATGYFEDGQGHKLGTCAADLALAAYAGAALSLVPAAAARDAVGARALDTTLRENFAEVLNVLCCAFDAGGGRVKLSRFVFAPEPMADALQGAGVNLQVDIDGYGSGLLYLRTKA